MTLTFDGSERELPDLGPKEKLAGVLASTYPFAMHKRYAREKDGTWRLGYRTMDLPKGHSVRDILVADNALGAAERNKDDKRPEHVRSQWINAFTFDQKDGFKAKWLFEAYITSHGGIYVNPNKTKKTRNRASKEKGLILKGHSRSKRVNELFGLVNGRHVAYWFVGSRHRISVKALERFEAIPDLFRKVTLFSFLPKKSDTGLDRFGARVIGYVKTEDDMLAIPVDSPLEVGKYLHGDLKHWQEEHLRIVGGTATSAGTAMDVTPSAQNIKDINRYTVSKFVDHFASDPKIGVDLQLCLAKGGLDDAKAFARRYEVKRERAARIVEAVAGDLCHWMETAAFRIVREEMEKDEGHILIPDYSRCIEALVGTHIGVNFLTREIERIEADPDDPIHKVVFSEEHLKAVTTKVTRAVISDAILIFGTHRSIQLTNVTEDAAEMFEVFNKKLRLWYSGSDILDILDNEYKVLCKARPTDQMHLTVYRVAPVNARVMALKEGQAIAREIEGNLTRVLHLFNVGLALHAYASIPDTYSTDKKTARDASVVTGVQTTATIARKMIVDQNLHMAKKRWMATAHVLGFVATAVTAYHDYRTASGLAKAGDTDAAIWYIASTGMSLFSSGLGLCASIFFRSSVILRSACNIIVLIGTLLAAFFYFIYLTSKDTDIETFFRNCRFGKNAGLGGDATRTWSTVTLGELYDKWSNQIEAIYALTRGFAVKVRQSRVEVNAGFGERFRTRVYLDPGEVFEDDEFVVTWWWRTMDDNKTWKHDEATLYPIPRKKGDKALISGSGHSRLVSLKMPDHVKKLDDRIELADLSVNIQKKIRGVEGTVTLPFNKYGLQIDFIKWPVHVQWEDGKIVASAKS